MSRAAALARWNLRIVAVAIIATAVLADLFGTAAPTVAGGGFRPGGRQAALLAGSGSMQALATVTALGWFAARWLPAEGRRLAAFVFGPLLMFPNVVAGCIIRMEYPDRGVPGIALILGGYLVFAMTVYAITPAAGRDDD